MTKTEEKLFRLCFPLSVLLPNSIGYRCAGLDDLPGSGSDYINSLCIRMKTTLGILQTLLRHNFIVVQNTAYYAALFLHG